MYCCSESNASYFTILSHYVGNRSRLYSQRLTVCIVAIKSNPNNFYLQKLINSQVIDFNGISNCLEIFDAKRWENTFFEDNYDIQYFYLIISKQIYLIHEEARASTTTPNQNGSESNGNDGILDTPQNWSFTIRCSLVSIPRTPLFLGDTISVFYAPITGQTNSWSWRV